MINYAYFPIISSLILIHSLIGIVVLAMGFVFAINKGSLEIKEGWKTKRNIQILEALWIINFISGTFIY